LESNHTALALCSNRIVTPNGVRPGAVLFRDEKIVDVVARESVPPECRREEFHEQVIMPGLVDHHVHINEPRQDGQEWEGFETATRAAAAGGITTLVDMPLNNIPVTTTVDALCAKIETSAAKMSVDCGFHAGVVPGNAGEIQQLIEAGVLGVKAFLIDSGLREFQNVTATDVRSALPAIAQSGLPLLVHAELASVPTVLASQDCRSYSSYLASRPRRWEQDAIELMVGLCREFNCRTHIVHLSSADAVSVLRAAKREGLPVTVETCPHYLFFSAEGIPDMDTRFKCAPPIREEENRTRLWAALEEGVIDCIVSDHSPCPPEMKHLASGDLNRAWGGIASLQFGLSVVWTEARRKGFTAAHLAEWMCRQPARLVGLEGKKGAIAPGYDADFVVWDPEDTTTIEHDMIHHRHKTTPYEGRTLSGRVSATFLRGRKIYEGGKFFGPFGTPLLRHQLHKAAAWSN
jgi:allantoinase